MSGRRRISFARNLFLIFFFCIYVYPVSLKNCPSYLFSLFNDGLSDIFFVLYTRTLAHRPFARTHCIDVALLCVSYPSDCLAGPGNQFYFAFEMLAFVLQLALAWLAFTFLPASVKKGVKPSQFIKTRAHGRMYGGNHSPSILDLYSLIFLPSC
jgi:hypothetical protein